MLNKTINIDVVASTFPRNRVPPALRLPRTINIDMQAALVMLGSVTVPGGYSSASPARYWAWIRYFSAISTAPDLRIVEPFLDLDPHQKTILSDDFGIAVGTRWLCEVLGATSLPVDGRRFLLLYSSLVRTPPRRRPRKVGPEKCPDFVVRDAGGRWHVLECKCTQSSLDYRNRQFRTAVLQKRAIDVQASTAGEQLAVGLFLGNDRGSEPSHLRVVDPPADPLITVQEDKRKEADIAANRLAISRAFGLAGLNAIAEELSLPTESQKEFVRLYSRGELRRLRKAPQERLTEAVRSIDQQPQASFQEGNQHFVGRMISVDIPGEEFYQNTGHRRVTVKQGIRAEVVDRTRTVRVTDVDVIQDLASPFLTPREGVRITSTDEKVVVKEGDLFVTTAEFD